MSLPILRSAWNACNLLAKHLQNTCKDLQDAWQKILCKGRLENPCIKYAQDQIVNPLKKQESIRGNAWQICQKFLQNTLQGSSDSRITGNTYSQCWSFAVVEAKKQDSINFKQSNLCRGLQIVESQVTHTANAEVLQWWKPRRRIQSISSNQTFAAVFR